MWPGKRRDPVTHLPPVIPSCFDGSMLLGYNTNGLAHHDAVAAIRLLGEMGYQSVALTIDHHCLPPGCPNHPQQFREIQEMLGEYGMRNVIETGARFLLDPTRKHHPTLMCQSAEGRQRRVDYLRYCIDTAAELNSDCVSLWSGASDDSVELEAGLERLADALLPVLDHAQQAGVDVGFEPEPGMFIDTMSSFFRLLSWIDHPALKVTMDLGHLFCQGELPMAPHIHRWADRLVNVHIEDMRAGAHLHLMFGEGEMSFPPILQALQEVGYENGLHVELSRDSHRGPEVAERSLQFLKQQLSALR